MHTIPLKTMGDSRSMELYRNAKYRRKSDYSGTQPRFNEPLHNEVLYISIEQSYGTEPRFNEILVITNTIRQAPT